MPNSTMSNSTSSSLAAPLQTWDISPSRLSYDVFEAIMWLFFAFAILMMLARTIYRAYTFRRLDVDDCLLIFAAICLSAACALTHVLWPYMLAQNQVTIGQLIPGADFSAYMLESMKLETAATNLHFAAIYSVKLSYMMFFRSLLSRASKFMKIWWWVVLAGVISCALCGFVAHWTICPHYTLDFLSYCTVEQIAENEHQWLIITTVTDILADAFIISVPVMILWNVKIPLKAKLSIGIALCLSLFMMVIAIIRIAAGFLAPGISDTIWIYFCWALEASTAVFMVSATAFRSTFGYRQKQKKTKYSQVTATGTVTKEKTSRVMISTTTEIGWQEDDHSSQKTAYQCEIEGRAESRKDIV